LAQLEGAEKERESLIKILEGQHRDKELIALREKQIGELMTTHFQGNSAGIMALAFASYSDKILFAIFKQAGDRQKVAERLFGKRIIIPD
jgi:hypothetical protein